MLGALCFGTFFGFPFIVWGLFLIFDRDRTWRKQIEKDPNPRERTKAWDTRQIIYGSLLVAVGTILFVVLALINFAAQSISPTLNF